MRTTAEEALDLPPTTDGQTESNAVAADASARQAPNGAAAATAGPVSRAGFLGHIDSCVRGLAAWLGAAANDAARQPTDALASAETSRIQLWRWLHCGNAVLDDGTPIDFALFDSAIQRVGERLPRRGLPGQGNLLQAAWLLAELTHAHTLAESVTVTAPARGC